MSSRRDTRVGLVKVLALTMAVVLVLFTAQVLSHTHANGQDEANCRICQAAHLGIAPTAGTPLVGGPLVATGYAQPFLITLHQEFLFHHSPSRAPPTA